MVQFNQDLRFVQALDEHLTAGHRILSAPDYAQARKHEKWLKKKNRDYKLYLAQLAPPA